MRQTLALLSILMLSLGSALSASPNTVYMITEIDSAGYARHEALDLSLLADNVDPVQAHISLYQPINPSTTQILWATSDAPFNWTIGGNNIYHFVEFAVIPAGVQITYRFHLVNEPDVEIVSARHTKQSAPWGINPSAIESLDPGLYKVTAHIALPGAPDQQLVQRLNVVDPNNLGGNDDPEPGNEPDPEPVDEPANPTPTPPSNPGRLTSGRGFSGGEKSPDTQIIYVSESQGNDSNDGLSPQTPVKTLAKGQSLLRHDSPDWLLLKAGDTWDGESFTDFDKSGRSVDEPMVVGVYGSGSRPMIIPAHNQAGFKTTNHRIQGLIIQGLHIYPATRDPGNRRFISRSEDVKGIWVKIHSGEDRFVKGLVIEDCLITHFDANIKLVDDRPRILRTQGVPGRLQATVRRNIIRYATTTGSHAVGIYLEGTRDTLIEENLLDHNGWAQTDGFEMRNKKAHNIYAQTYNGPITVRNNIFTRAAAHGLQLRAGGIVERNLFYRNAAAFYCSRNDSKALYNVVLESDDMNPNDPLFYLGYGIEGWGMNRYEVVGNLVARRIGSVQKSGIEAYAKELVLRHNVVYDWSSRQGVAIKYDGNKITFEDNHSDQEFGVRVVYVNPERGLDDFARFLSVDNADQLLDLLASRGRGDWAPQLSAEGINQYIRDGFRIKEVIQIDQPGEAIQVDVNFNAFGMSVQGDAVLNLATLGS